MKLKCWNHRSPICTGGKRKAFLFQTVCDIQHIETLEEKTRTVDDLEDINVQIRQLTSFVSALVPNRLIHSEKFERLLIVNISVSCLEQIEIFLAFFTSGFCCFLLIYEFCHYICNASEILQP